MGMLPLFWELCWVLVLVCVYLFRFRLCFCYPADVCAAGLRLVASVRYLLLALSSLTAKKGAYYARWFVQSILLTWREKGSCKVVLWYKPCLVYMQCRLAMKMLFECKTPTWNCSADLQYHYRYSLYWQCSLHTWYVFCRTLVYH